MTSVAVNVKQDGQTKEVIIPVTVLPEAPKIPVAVPKSLTESVISWKLSPNATSYDVKVKGALVCQTTASSCTAPVAIGPKTPVEITANGGDNLKSVITPTYQPVKPIPAITVNFATNSSVLSSAQKAELNKIAKYIVEEGFLRLVVHGYTDSRGGVDNQALSVARAQSTADYLAKLAPGIDFVVSGFGPSKPIASNKTDAGMAANRRAELSLW
ncbi:MAG: OmpA family protein [Actinobacteria bacterium]|nr:OmpA family protein [Actinomycetota bacterium]